MIIILQWLNLAFYNVFSNIVTFYTYIGNLCVYNGKLRGSICHP